MQVVIGSLPVPLLWQLIGLQHVDPSSQTSPVPLPQLPHMSTSIEQQSLPSPLVDI